MSNTKYIKEQLRVLSKLVGTGTRLADSIFRTLNDYKNFIINSNVYFRIYN